MMTLPPVVIAVASALEDVVGMRIKNLPVAAEKVLRVPSKKQYAVFLTDIDTDSTRR